MQINENLVLPQWNWGTAEDVDVVLRRLKFRIDFQFKK
jgi:hypothetical protein